MALILTLAIGTAREVLPMPHVTDARDLIRIGMTMEEAERILPIQETLRSGKLFEWTQVHYFKSSVTVLYVGERNTWLQVKEIEKWPRPLTKLQMQAKEWMTSKGSHLDPIEP